jgi:hypothetical protein
MRPDLAELVALARQNAKALGRFLPRGLGNPWGNHSWDRRGSRPVRNGKKKAGHQQEWPSVFSMWGYLWGNFP